MAAVSCFKVAKSGTWHDAADRLSLTYEARFLRRKKLATQSGLQILLDLPETTSLRAGDALILDDGRVVEIQAAPESLIKVSGADLPRLAWHIGNRHTPCQIEQDHLLIAHDHVLADMLAQLGAAVEHVTQPFTPEGGAYGHGRTMGHSHGHDHAHDH